MVEFRWKFRQVPLNHPLSVLNSSAADALNIVIDPIPFQHRAAVFDQPIPRIAPVEQVEVVPTE